MIDLTCTRFVLVSLERRLTIEQMLWMESLVPNCSRKFTAIHVDGIENAKNQAVFVALESQEDFFVFMDDDVRPGPEANAFLRLDADVKCCEVPMQGERAWSQEDSFHDTLWCTSRRVLEAIEPPWFEWPRNTTHTAYLGCLCSSFKRKVVGAGFTVAHGGHAGHDSRKTWCR